MKNVKTIHVVAINNEVKELLWILEKGFNGVISIETVNMKRDAIERFGFKLEEKHLTKTAYSKPLTYFYEPNTAILKSGGFHEVSEQLDVYKLHQHSHLYTSETLIEFPGRTFRTQQVLLYNKKEVKRLGIKKANITTRNFPESVAQLRKKLNIKDGGNTYLFFTTNCENQKILIVAYK